MNISQNLNVQLTQKLTLSHEMLQSLELIQLPVLELREKIEQEVLENPALEIIERDNKKDFPQKIDLGDEVFDERDRFYNEINNNTTYSSHKTSEEEDSKRMFLEGAISKKEGLHDKLKWQLNLLDLTEKQKEIGETIISFIDPNGFFKEDINILFPNDKSMALAMLETIQTFDPPGIASVDIREALLYQIESLPPSQIDKNAYKIVKNHFRLLLARKDPQIMKLLNITAEEVKRAFTFISHFELYPGRAYDNSENDYIVPDAFVYRKEGDLLVEINNEILPELTISKYLERIAERSKSKRKLDQQKRYIVDKVNNAKKFIDMIHNRNNSLFKVILAIVKKQRIFFYKGPKYLVPLVMKEIAEEVGLAESTVSRLSSSKYIQTEWGIHELKYFFTNAIENHNGDKQSSESIREMIKEIIEVNTNKKISDQKIADILQNRGIQIARRTVAKYRNILNILPANKRNI